MLKKSILSISLLLTMSQQSFAASPPNPMQTWVLMGDSIMSAVSPSVVDGPSGTSKQLAANLLMNNKNVSIRNISSPGNSIGHSDFTGFGNTLSVTQSLDRIGGFFGFYNGIIIQAGTNDFGRSVDLPTFKKSLEGILKHAKTRNKKVLLMEPIYRADQNVKNKVGLVLKDYSNAMKNLCTTYNTHCYFSDMSEEFFNQYSFKSHYDANEVKVGKALHLNASGHERYYRWIEFEASRAKFF